jgi:hypothetical protein
MDVIPLDNSGNKTLQMSANKIKTLIIYATI